MTTKTTRKASTKATWNTLPPVEWRGNKPWTLPKKLREGSKFGQQVLAVQSEKGLTVAQYGKLYASDAGPKGSFGSVLATACGVARAMGKGHTVQTYLPTGKDGEPDYPKGAARVVKQ